MNNTKTRISNSPVLNLHIGTNFLFMCTRIYINSHFKWRPLILLVFNYIHFFLIQYIYRQKLVKLQHENTMLKMNQKEPEEDKISVLQSLLDNTRQQYNELRLDNR